MITIAKLRKLKATTQIRKISMIFHQAALGQYSEVYLSLVLPLLEEEKAKSVLGPLSPQAEKLSRYLLEGHFEPTYEEDLCQLLLRSVGAEPSDWDFMDADGTLDGNARTVLPHTLVLDRLRSPFNVGSVFRTADSFGIEKIILIEGTASITHPRCLRTAKGTVDTVEHASMSEDDFCSLVETQSLPLFALELGGHDLSHFSFPREGIAVLGSEEFGVSPRLLSLCDQSLGRVSIALAGSKGSINVSVAAGIMLQQWFASTSV